MRPLSRPYTVKRPTDAQRRHLRRLSKRLGIEEPLVTTAAEARQALTRLERHRDARNQLTLDLDSNR